MYPGTGRKTGKEDMLRNKYKQEEIQTYVLPFDEKAKIKTNWITIGFALLMAAAQIGIGLVNQDSSRTFWIVYPYLFMFLPAAFMIVGAVSYMDAGVSMPTPQYDGSIRRMHRSALGILVMDGISAVCDVIYMVLYHSRIRIGAELVYLLGHLVLAAIVIAYAKYYDHIFAGIRVEEGKEIQ